eukprot:TRINITY_DN4257_c0_g1_i2.p2 TRINITY_DN4257_c0_g1~~TRINITY_DN4257_c0_g1_i2.p2  ORF type:complete len:287 (-),score=81.43 TRINITY_DN4257_c0_g1_i2:847-1707(-)
MATQLLRQLVLGGAGSCASAFLVHPFDVVKLNLQLRGMAPCASEGSQENVILRMWRTGGPGSFVKGAGTAVARQAVFGTTRVGTFHWLLSLSNNPSSAGVKLACASLSGIIAGTASNPLDVALVRISQDSRLPKEQRKGYTNLRRTLCLMWKEEGPRSLFAGVVPNAMRSVALQISHQVVYTYAKASLVKVLPNQKKNVVQAAASTVAALICSFSTMPCDTLKTAQMRRGAKRQNVAACAAALVQDKGVWRGLWGGWGGLGAYAARQAPHTVLTLLFIDKLNALFR